MTALRRDVPGRYAVRRGDVALSPAPPYAGTPLMLAGPFHLVVLNLLSGSSRLVCSACWSGAW